MVEEKSIKERAQQMSPSAIEILAEIMTGQQNGASVADRLKAAISILEVAGFISAYTYEDD